MKLRYVNPKAEGLVTAYGLEMSHGDVVDFSVLGEKENFFYRKALKTPHFVIIADEVVEKRKPGRPPKVKHGDVG